MNQKESNQNNLNTSVISNIANISNINDIPTRTRQQSVPRTVRPTVIEKEIQPTVSQGVKLSAYQMLKAVTKKRDEEDLAKKAAQQPVQNKTSKMPLMQIRPQGIKIAAHAQNNNTGGGLGYNVPHLPVLALNTGSKNKLDAPISSDAKEHDFEGQINSQNSSIRNSNPNGRISLGSNNSQEKDLNNAQYQSDISSKGRHSLGNHYGDSSKQLSTIEKDTIDLENKGTSVKEKRSHSQDKDEEEMFQELPDVRRRAATNAFEAEDVKVIKLKKRSLKKDSELSDSKLRD